mgnify:CR=1 FL=1
MSRQAHITLVDGVETSALDIADRGLAYGDGLFETMRVIVKRSSGIKSPGKMSASVPLLKWHVARFQQGVERLRLGSTRLLARQFKTNLNLALEQILANGRLDSALIKVIVTRGHGGRGYTPPQSATCSIITQVFDLPDYPEDYSKTGIQVCLCEHTLAIQPALAGIKHLNRLEQVIASQELGEEQEGLLFDQNGLLVEGIKSNVLLFEGDSIVTPKLDKCGVNGTLRQYLIQHASAIELNIQEEMIDRDRLIAADGVAMINSVFGVWPVSILGEQALDKHANCELIQKYLHQHLKY